MTNKKKVGTTKEAPTKSARAWSTAAWVPDSAEESEAHAADQRRRYELLAEKLQRNEPLTTQEARDAAAACNFTAESIEPPSRLGNPKLKRKIPLDVVFAYVALRVQGHGKTEAYLALAKKFRVDPKKMAERINKLKGEEAFERVRYAT